MIIAGLAGMAWAGPLPATETGADLYQENCAACHGRYAEGDGPAASALALPVPDLTQLAARSGGEYPGDRIRAVIDGGAEMPAHGSRSMPIWGKEFWLEAGADEAARTVAAQRIETLVEFLETLQQP
jgi:mono/diheme cytochrome c family protein